MKEAHLAIKTVNEELTKAICELTEIAITYEYGVLVFTESIEVVETIKMALAMFGAAEIKGILIYENKILAISGKAY